MRRASKREKTIAAATLLYYYIAWGIFIFLLIVFILAVWG